ncbi:hypothetical protein [Paenibacillus sp. NPDC057967]|uniref:hypothetical protein n=1 Tax=Paenibacillus sp. NPDC057967 TaxID=3346293 RepID=UPI0036DECBB7
MKKALTLCLLILLLSSTAVIYADSKSLIGRTIKSEAAVTLNGKDIGQALIIDGVSYAPVRVIAEASGLEVGYKKGEVILTTETDVTIDKQAADIEPVSIEAMQKEKKRLEIESQTLSNYINDADKVIAIHKDALSKVDDTLKETYEEMIDKAEEEKAGYQRRLAEIESRLAKIEVALSASNK